MNGVSRRGFLTTGMAGLAGLGARAAEPGSSPAAGSGAAEPARRLPIAGAFDVAVCGGGPAGVATALASARGGARTCLIESQGCLGGIWTSGLLGWILDHANKPGIMKEILDGLAQRGARAAAPDGKATNGYDPEAMKLLLEDLCTAAKVEIHLHTRVCSALRAGDRIEHAVIESRSGREAVAAKVFVDCTGDGDLAAHAGCGFDFGHPETGLAQPMTLMALVSGIVPAEVREFYREDDRGEWAKPKDCLRAEMEHGGHSPSYAKPSLFRLRDDLFALMTNHEYGVRGTDARDVTAATLRARREVNALIDGLRKLGPPWANLRLVATAAQIGVREGRRIRGLYTVSADDLREGRQPKDGVCRVAFGVDVHATDPKKEKGIEKTGIKAKPYDIPLRALIAKDAANLMMAGRCISGDFIAHSIYRVTGNSVRLGEAAGVAAALAALGGVAPADVLWDEVQRKLASSGS